MKTYTHKGWFGAVPVLIVDPQANDMELCARWGLPDELIDLQAWIFDLIAWVMRLDECGYPIRVTGRNKP